MVCSFQCLMRWLSDKCVCSPFLSHGDAVDTYNVHPIGYTLFFSLYTNNKCRIAELEKWQHFLHTKKRPRSNEWTVSCRNRIEVRLWSLARAFQSQCTVPKLGKPQIYNHENYVLFTEMHANKVFVLFTLFDTAMWENRFFPYFHFVAR